MAAQLERFKVLVTSVGSMSGVFIVNRLKRLGCDVVGANVNLPEAPEAAKYCDAFLSVPHSAEPDVYVEKMLAMVESQGVELVLPLTDPEAVLLSRNAGRFSNIGAEVVVPNIECLDRVRDKFLLAEQAGAIGDLGCEVIPHRLSLSAAFDTFGLPLIGKPRIGRSSQGVIVFDGSFNTEVFVEGDHMDYLFQPYLDGKVCTVDALRVAACQETYCLARRELSRTKNGAGLRVEILDCADAEEVYTATDKLLNYFGIDGLVNIEFLECSQGVFLLDFNIRASAGIQYSYRAGFDFIGALFCADRRKMRDFFGMSDRSVMAWLTGESLLQVMGL